MDPGDAKKTGEFKRKRKMDSGKVGEDRRGRVIKEGKRGCVSGSNAG